MGLKAYVRSQLIEIIDWSDPSRDTLSFRFPDEDCEIKRGAQLVVRESQAAQFVYLGQFGDTYGPGTHTLTTDNIPVLTRLRGWKYGFESPFKADVYFVTTRLFPGLKWGTVNPIMMHDPDFGIVRLRAFGTYDVHVADVKTFLKEVAGTDRQFLMSEFADVMRSRIVSAFSNALVAAHVPALDIAGRYRELGEALLPVINPILRNSYGLEVPNLVVENVSVPPEVEQAIEKRSTLQAIGNLNDYVKYQVAQSFDRAGTPSAAGGFAGEMAVGLVMAQQILKQTGVLGAAPAADASSGGTAAAVDGIPETLSPAQVAEALKVTEADVLASLEAGDLKGKRVGPEWRVTRAAVSQFLQ